MNNRRKYVKQFYERSNRKFAKLQNFVKSLQNHKVSKLSKNRNMEILEDRHKIANLQNCRKISNCTVERYGEVRCVVRWSVNVPVYKKYSFSLRAHVLLAIVLIFYHYWIVYFLDLLPCR